MQPLVSVVIPTYNSEKYIRRTVESALSQTYRNIEIIVVDDGSTDNTREVLKRYSDRIQYIYKENAGPASARNVGIKHAKGEYIAFLDSDDMWLPEKIELQMKLLFNGNDIGVIGCNYYSEDENGKVSEVKYSNYTNNKLLQRDLLFRNMVSGGTNAVVKKECFDKVGLFDETLRGTEDWDMWIRISQYYRIQFVEVPLFKARIRSGSVSSPQNINKMLENELAVIKKHFSYNQVLRKKIFLKMRIYSYRFFCTAWVFHECGQKKKAFNCILKSFLLSPFEIITKKRVGLFARILLGIQ